MRISLLAAWGFIVFGALLFIASAVNVLSQRPADVAQQPTQLTISIILAVVGVALIVVGAVKRRRLQHQ